MEMGEWGGVVECLKGRFFGYSVVVCFKNKDSGQECNDGRYL